MVTAQAKIGDLRFAPSSSVLFGSRQYEMLLTRIQLGGLRAVYPDSDNVNASVIITFTDLADGSQTYEITLPLTNAAQGPWVDGYSIAEYEKHEGADASGVRRIVTPSLTLDLLQVVVLENLDDLPIEVEFPNRVTGKLSNAVTEYKLMQTKNDAKLEASFEHTVEKSEQVHATSFVILPLQPDLPSATPRLLTGVTTKITLDTKRVALGIYTDSQDVHEVVQQGGWKRRATTTAWAQKSPCHAECSLFPRYTPGELSEELSHMILHHTLTTCPAMDGPFGHGCQGNKDCIACMDLAFVCSDATLRPGDRAALNLATREMSSQDLLDRCFLGETTPPPGYPFSVCGADRYQGHWNSNCAGETKPVGFYDGPAFLEFDPSVIIAQVHHVESVTRARSSHVPFSQREESPMAIKSNQTVGLILIALSACAWKGAAGTEAAQPDPDPSPSIGLDAAQSLSQMDANSASFILFNWKDKNGEEGAVPLKRSLVRYGSASQFAFELPVTLPALVPDVLSIEARIPVTPLAGAHWSAEANGHSIGNADKSFNFRVDSLLAVKEYESSRITLNLSGLKSVLRDDQEDVLTLQLAFDDPATGKRAGVIQMALATPPSKILTSQMSTEDYFAAKGDGPRDFRRLTTSSLSLMLLQIIEVKNGALYPVEMEYANRPVGLLSSSFKEITTQEQVDEKTLTCSTTDTTKEWTSELSKTFYVLPLKAGVAEAMPNL